MFRRIAERMDAWRAPQARNARKAKRRRAWNEALSETQTTTRARWHAPSPTETYTKNTRR
jgi:hypothetical protein